MAAERIDDIKELEEVVKTLASKRNVARVQKIIESLKQEGVAAEAAVAAKAPKPAPIKPVPKRTPEEVAPALPIASGSTITYIPIDTFGWDQSGKFVSLYLTKGLEGVGEAEVTSSFGEDWFDLKILNLRGRNFRLKKEGLDKNIVPSKSKHKVSAKNNMVTIKLRKAEGEYGPDHWTDLTPKFKKDKKAAAADPTAGIMDMMKQMYDEGDDTMKATIGKAMLEAQKKKQFA